MAWSQWDEDARPRAAIARAGGAGFNGAEPPGDSKLKRLYSITYGRKCNRWGSRGIMHCVDPYRSRRLLAGQPPIATASDVAETGCRGRDNSPVVR